MSNATSSPNDLNIVAIIDNHRWKLLYIFITGCTLSVCVFGRSLYEQHKRKALSWDNAVIGLSLIFAIVMQVLAITPVRAEIQLKMATALFVLSKSLSSTYVLLLLRRVSIYQFLPPVLKYPTTAVTTVAIVANALGVAAPLAGCVISETASEAFCHPMEPVFLAAIAFDIFKGIWLFALSAYRVHQLMTNSLAQRVLLLAYLVLGLTSTCVRVYVLVQIASSDNDLARDVATGITWSFLEVNLNVIGACLPTVRSSPKRVVFQMPDVPLQAVLPHTPSTSHSSQNHACNNRDWLDTQICELGYGGVLIDDGDGQPQKKYIDSINDASSSLMSEAMSSTDYDDTEALRGGPHRAQF
ncbi:hypothetical protein CGGC5_v005904 [Colletotrichum fructicola Nara gc5]|uniref:Rhodopsin domain-containing protein n=2 Tax=Colletotrichum fructicola (strain Nara gc5) TaxID=1213859 RepID=A0A7J6JB00_COLFN|nr:hypothetical protein CGGC5_v005904 [Colletotrichum fructicola Nara gc5]